MCVILVACLVSCEYQHLGTRTIINVWALGVPSPAYMLAPDALRALHEEVGEPFR